MISREIVGSKHLIAFTGAGASTESGVPDYRSKGGIWDKFQPIYIDEFMSSRDARVKYWKRKAELYPALIDAQPNAAHNGLAELYELGFLKAIITQNIDGLHRDAGTSPGLLVEIHGTTREVECQSCLERSDPGPHRERFAETGEPPVCNCGGYIKSATISFGQQLRQADVARAFDAAKRADLAISLGSTLSVTPAADIPIEAAMAGARYAIVNQGDTEHDGLGLVTLRVEGEVGEVFAPAVETALK